MLQDISGAHEVTRAPADQKGAAVESSVVRIVAHVDMDAFYAAVEERYRPELRGRPVVVGADPKGGRGRGVVTAANYAARRYGIRSALPISRAWRLAESARRKGEPEAVFVRGDRSLYREVSGRIMAIIAQGGDAFEEASIDEAYLDLSSLGGMQEAEAHARRLKAEILAREGLTCSIGIGPNKLVAKMASDADKPDGFVVLSREDAIERFANEPPGLVPGIGPKTAERLKEKGIETLGQLARTPDAELAEMFGGRLGPHLAKLACFEDDRVVETVRIAKSESRETTFERDLHGLHALEPVLEQLCTELCETLNKQENAGRTIGIKVRLDDFSTHTRARSITEPTNDLEVVRRIACQLLRDFDPPRPVRLLGVRVAGLDDGETLAAAGQLELAL
jgi:DNA polymerase-4